MTQKEVMAIVRSRTAMEILQEMARIEANMIHKTKYEQKTAKAKLKNFARMIASGITEETEDTEG